MGSMPTLTELCKRYFGCTDLYDVLRIPKTADEKQVRKAYHRLSLIVHPDRVENEKKAEATEKFKVLGKVHSILSDKEKKSIYDDTGSYDEEDEQAEKDWSEYWRRLFKKITLEDINRYEKRSEEELGDLKRAYIEGKGNFDWILETVPFSHVEEESRFREILQPFIDSGEIPAFKAFTNESVAKREKRKRKWEKEAEEAKALREEMGISQENDLKALIQSRQQQRMADSDSFLDQLAAKYAPKKNGVNSKEKTKSTTPKKRGSRAK
ncbi:DnaJ subfamily C member 9 [Gryllus bimaculatus]|nr:DnaJ subfamily C member 9 [Gryllus bimaculatus]